MTKSTEILHKELDLIQACIKKYDDRSILIRGWSVALIGLIIGLTQSNIVIILDPKAIPTSLMVLLFVNGAFYMLDKQNSKKKYQYVLLYKWVIKNRSFENNEPWKHLYSLDYKRFDGEASDFKSSSFGSTLYSCLWAFILSLMVWHTVLGIINKEEVKKAGQEVKK